MTFSAAMTALRACALSLQENATYLLDELPKVQMTESLRQEMVEICGSMVATKHDVISVLADIDDMQGPGSGYEEILRRLERCLAWIRQEFDRLHQVEVALQREAASDATAATGFILVAESAVNVLHAFQEAKEQVDELLG